LLLLLLLLPLALLLLDSLLGCCTVGPTATTPSRVLDTGIKDASSAALQASA
jgi:hypothetical protein